MIENNNNNYSLSPIYQVYSDLGEIDPDSVKTEEDIENYYKSLLWGCKNCDLILENKIGMTVHFCSRNGKSKFYEHQQEALNRKIERLKLSNNNNEES
jgi:hypothetical protein